MGNLKDFSQDKRNANKGTARGQKQITGSIQRNGFGRSIVADKNRVIVGGNKTIEASAEVFGVEVEPIIIESDGTRPIIHVRTDLNLDDPDPNNPARRLAYEDNFSSWFSFELDPEVVTADMGQGFDFEAIDVSLVELGEMLEGSIAGLLNNPPKDVEPKIDQAAELQKKWGTALGQVWQLGEHRLIIGDCTDKAVIEAVAFGESIDFIYVDPPYSVSYADKNASLNAVAFGNRIQTPIINDHLSTEETAQKIWVPAFINLFEIAKPGGVYYCSAPQGGDQMMMMMMMLCEAGWLVKHELIWVKNNHVLGRADYQYKHEPIIYGWKPGAGHYFVDSRSEFSVWQIDKPHNSDLHPTTKPVELVERAMKNSSKPGDICLDSFVGSGTTIIAGENLKRKVRAIELDEGYAAVSIQRWHDLTTRDPIRLNG
jgi:DNA modification methylase